MYVTSKPSSHGIRRVHYDNLAEAMGEEGPSMMVGHVTNASHNECAAAHQKREVPPKMTLLEAEPRVESQRRDRLPDR